MNSVTRKILSCCCFFGLITSSYAGTNLGVFINEVVEHNPAIQAAKSNVFAAKARAKASSLPIYNPELVAENQKAIEDTELLGINQTIDWANKRDARKHVGVANVWVAQAELENLRQQLGAAIISALAKYHAEKNVVRLAKQRTSLFQQFVSISNDRLKNGDIARVDLDLAQLALSEALAQQADAEVRMNQALQSLRAITGFSQMAWPVISNSLPPLSLDKINVDHLVSHLPVFQVSNRKYQSALARIKMAERDRYPDPTIGFQGGRQLEGSEKKRLIGLTLSIPLFVRNPYRAEVDAASFDAVEADSKREDLIRQARAEIISSAERYRTLFGALRSWEQLSRKPLSNGMVLTQRLWQAGEITPTDYVVQLKQRIDSQIAGIELKSRAWEAWSDWLKASGQIENWLQIDGCHQES